MDIDFENAISVCGNEDCYGKGFDLYICRRRTGKVAGCDRQSRSGGDGGEAGSHNPVFEGKGLEGLGIPAQDGTGDQAVPI